MDGGGFEALAREARARAREGDPDGAAACWERAAEEREARGLAGQGARARLAAARCLQQAGRVAEARERLVALVAGAEGGRDRGLLGAALLELAELRSRDETPEAALPTYRRATALLEAEGLRDERLRLRLGLAEAALAAGQRAEAVRQADLAVPHLEGEDDRGVRALGQAVACVVSVGLGVRPAPDRMAVALQELAAAGDARRGWRLAMALARGWQEAGDLEAAEAAFGDAARFADAAGLAAEAAPSWLALSDHLAACGRTVEADDAVERALGAARAAGDRDGLALCVQRGLGLAATLGQPGIFLARARVGAALAAERGDPAERLRLLARSLEVAVAAGRSEADELAVAVVAALGRADPGDLPTGEAADTARRLGELGHGEAARELALGAARAAFAGGRPDGAAAALAVAADLTDRQGDVALAAEMWDEVVRLGEHFGLAASDVEAWQAARADAFRRRGSPPGPPLG